MTFKIEVAGRDVNVGAILPLKLGDWRQLEKSGITPKRLEEGSVEALIGISYYVLHKADPTVTTEQVEAEFTIADKRLVDMILQLNTTEARLDRPT